MFNDETAAWCLNRSNNDLCILQIVYFIFSLQYTNRLTYFIVEHKLDSQKGQILDDSQFLRRLEVKHFSHQNYVCIFSEVLRRNLY